MKILRCLFISILAIASMHLFMRALKAYTILGTIESNYQIYFITGSTMMIFGILLDLLLVDRQHSRIRGFCFWKRKEDTPSYLKGKQIVLLLVLVIGLGVANQLRLESTIALSVLWVLSKFFIVALGEELLFRGFLLSYWNQNFSYSYSYNEIPLTAGVFLSSAFFGAVHVLNTYDYFSGTGSLDWSWGLGTFGAGLILACVTQYCNALGPGIFLHGARLALASQTPDFIKLAMS